MDNENNQANNQTGSQNIEATPLATTATTTIEKRKRGRPRKDSNRADSKVSSTSAKSTKTKRTKKSSKKATNNSATKNVANITAPKKPKAPKKSTAKKQNNITLEKPSKRASASSLNTSAFKNIDSELASLKDGVESISSYMKEQFVGDKSRFVTAFILLGILVLILAINSPLLTCVVLALLCIVAVQEAINLYGLDSAPHYYIATAVAWFLAYINERVIESALIILVLYASYLAYTKHIKLKALLPFIYPVIPFLSIYALYVDAGGAGVWVLVWLIVIVALTDTGAYFGGKAFGKTPFCETSPKKTMEGVICGVVCGVIFGSLVGIGACGNFIYAVIISIFVALSAVFGDLFESYLKREAKIKDSGSLLPGHGGVLDRLDAVLFGAVVMHFLLFFLPGYKYAALIF